MSHRHKVVALSKFMAYILRHRPDEFGLVLDKDGFASLKELQQAITEEEGWTHVRQPDIIEVVYTDERKQFEMEDDRIRATHGHSAASKISYGPTAPPQLLFHGARRRSYHHILERGLDASGGQYVHLTTNPELALRIGRRRDPHPVLLHIHAEQAFEEGIVFYRANPLIFLADHVPPAYINGPPLSSVVPEPKRPPKEESTPKRAQTPGSVLLNLTMEPVERRGKQKTWKESSRRHRRKKRHV